MHYYHINMNQGLFSELWHCFQEVLQKEDSRNIHLFTVTHSPKFFFQVQEMVYSSVIARRSRVKGYFCLCFQYD